MRKRVICALALALAGLAAPAGAGAALRAGAGKADITPATGYYLGGWTRADRTAQGQHTRLHSRAVVLENGGRKVALVSIDLFMVPGGMVRHIGEALASRGLSERNILISASHTHSGPGGYANYPSLNTAAPSLATATDAMSWVALLRPAPADPQLYRFLTERVTAAIRRADDDLGPAAAGWGSARILGLTRNRSLEGHLANHGIIRARGEGRESEDPGGYEHTIDPEVDVLRVDKLVRRGRRGRRRTVRVPIGAWSNFADHGTVTKSSFQFYNGDHTASAMRVFEARVRAAGRVGAAQEIVNVYGNSNEGDMSAGLDRHGPAASDYVGRVEGAAMLRAWKRARRRLTREPVLDVRWTRLCFCGQAVQGGGRVSNRSEVGAPFATGSEEERGPLYEATGDVYEDRRGPDTGDPHGMKMSVYGASTLPNVVPLLAVRVGPRLIVSIPGEGTKEVGARMRAAVESAIAGSPVERVVISGLVNEFVHYFTTPEEYDRQHYEGGSTQFGRWSSVLVGEEAAKLAGALVRGAPAPPPADFDPTNGVRPDGPPYPDGAATASLTAQPSARHSRLERAQVAWQGGPRGYDRPLDRAFVTVERRTPRAWVRADDDLGLNMLWKVDAAGRHLAQWEIPLDASLGTYRFVVTGKRYRLVSGAFEVQRTRALRAVA
ncbi:MAG TPA: neutral/alkaline non-lysosomal ceramidase N-terminal domain-containing protein, partial [Solirubrobacteraceae bacterium]|nr:neutral/alkaline non-lysosomal ceramidase N-terminal domain-containing protein [Solirubrobacteraceae bacterium]